MQNLFLLLLIGLFISSCEGLNHMKDVEQEKPGKLERKSFQTLTGKYIFISEKHPMGMSLSDIIIETQGFETEFKDSIYQSNPVSEIFLSDLNNDGYDEIYIVTRSVGSGSYGKIIAYASNRDKSLSPVYIQNGGTPLTDYSGHDVYRVDSGYLLRTYQKYAIPSDTGSDPKKTGNIRYKLKPGEAGWLLIPQETN